MTNAIRIVHTTRYRYSQPVKFGTHELLLRPRDGHDMRVISSALTIRPEARLRWHFDTFGNSVVRADFSEAADMLEIRSELLLRRFSHVDFLVSPDRVGSRYPFRYAKEDQIDLAPFMRLENPDEEAVLAGWLKRQAVSEATEVLAFLRALADTINGAVDYVRRDSSGTQTAAETIEAGSGSCRDFALLFMEAARYYGFAARFVTGYLNLASDNDQEHVGGGATHAWAEVFLPDEGWIEFDPTNRIVASPNLIRVAVTRTPYQALPVSGTYEQRAGTQFFGMEVDVEVGLEKYDAAVAV
ncbi:transglutaminase family protein [Roseibium sediminicola]|uniref:Transglutaminase family protein n=1 Tax=Roseibium sediminicola TaxID=2933272 RepID=A0ABT0GMH3_9HYPH|nr:transglutaminase family protein [Roseibium sp. CAU 1639]MCK7610526.1 transglutaminase family protein [Roseibium sp. CAU 1639]